MIFRVLAFVAALAFPTLGAAKFVYKPEFFDPNIDIELACSYAPSQSALINRLTGMSSGTVLGAELIFFTNSLSYVKHSSGLPILQASGRYVARTIGSNGALIVPAALVVAGAAVSVELICIPTNYPDEVAKLKLTASEYYDDAHKLLANASVKTKEVSSSKLESLTDTFKKYKTITRDKFYQLMGETWYQKAVRKTKEAFSSD